MKLHEMLHFVFQLASLTSVCYASSVHTGFVPPILRWVLCDMYSTMLVFFQLHFKFSQCNRTGWVIFQ